MEKSEQRKKEDYELLERFTRRLAIKNLYYASREDKTIFQCLKEFKKDEGLLPKNESGWYLSHDFTNWLVKHDFENSKTYGINIEEGWFCKGVSKVDSDEYLASDQQVKKLLKSFSEKLGYKLGTKVVCLHTHNPADSVIDVYDLRHIKLISDQLWFGDKCIMRDGEWAEIVEDEVKQKTE